MSVDTENLNEQNLKKEYETFNFTSEYIGRGHPDRIADTISDSILDACSAVGIERCAVETAIFQNKAIVFGECGGGPIDDKKYFGKKDFLDELIDVKKIVQQVLRDAGYDGPEGTDWKTIEVECYIVHQSSNIADAVTHVHDIEKKKQNMINRKKDSMTAGDQGIMFGYATDETVELMPVSLLVSREICFLIESLRKTYKFLKSDCKSQVTVQYRENNGQFIPINIHTIVVSVHHAKNLSNFAEEMISVIKSYVENTDGKICSGFCNGTDKLTSECLTSLSGMDLLRLFLKVQICSKIGETNLISTETQFLIQPSGLFEIGGPIADSGLTGRKTICDTYGGHGSHGGGAFSGKDWTKMDRTGAYAARWIAVSLIKAKLCKRVTIQLSYVIGLEDAISIYVDTYGSSLKSNNEIVQIIRNNFDLRPSALADALELDAIKFADLTLWGHFGRNFKWDEPKELVLKKQ